MPDYGDFKEFVSATIPISRDWWHLLAGVIILATCASLPALRRRRWRVPAALAIAFTLGVTLEALDFAGDLHHRVPPNWFEHATDILWTSLAPALASAALMARASAKRTRDD